MHAVIFEVEPKPERFEDYLAIAGVLRPELERIDGFIDNERFRHLARPACLLSLSTWRDEAALIRWRMLAVHRQAQERGRQEVFSDYRLRVGEVIADSDAADGLPGEPMATHPGAAHVTISELAPGCDAATAALPAPDSAGALASAAFESITTAGKRLWLTTWRDAASAENWTPRAQPGPILRHRRVRIIRDYGMDDRREAPQYYRPVKR
jgi:heme-degrading monooxygenase HmoA